MKKSSQSIFFSGIVLILMLGYIDFLTGDYSMDAFYLVVIFAVTFFTNRYLGIICVVEGIMAEILADYFVHKDAVFDALYYWNWLSDLVIFLSICLATSFFQRLVNKDFNKQ